LLARPELVGGKIAVAAENHGDVTPRGGTTTAGR
jgi:hypothetical protein